MLLRDAAEGREQDVAEHRADYDRLDFRGPVGTCVDLVEVGLRRPEGVSRA